MKKKKRIVLSTMSAALVASAFTPLMQAQAQETNSDEEVYNAALKAVEKLEKLFADTKVEDLDTLFAEMVKAQDYIFELDEEDYTRAEELHERVDAIIRAVDFEIDYEFAFNSIQSLEELWGSLEDVNADGNIDTVNAILAELPQLKRIVDVLSEENVRGAELKERLIAFDKNVHDNIYGYGQEPVENTDDVVTLYDTTLEAVEKLEKLFADKKVENVDGLLVEFFKAQERVDELFGEGDTRAEELQERLDEIMLAIDFEIDFEFAFNSIQSLEELWTATQFDNYEAVVADIQALKPIVEALSEENARGAELQERLTTLELEIEESLYDFVSGAISSAKRLFDVSGVVNLDAVLKEKQAAQLRFDRLNDEDPRKAELQKEFDELQLEIDYYHATATVENVEAEIKNGVATVTWDAFEGAKRYRILIYAYDEVSSEFVQQGNGRSSTVPNVKITNLKEDTKYQFKIIPVTAGTSGTVTNTANSTLSNIVEFTKTLPPVVEVEPTEPPSEIDGLNVQINGTTATLTWSDMKDISRYRVALYKKNEQGEFVREGMMKAVATTTYTYTNLSNNSEYQFVVEPRIGYAYDTKLALRTTKTIGTVKPTTDTTITVENDDLKVNMQGKTATISWERATIDGKDITNYRIVRYVKDETTGQYKQDGLTRAVAETSYKDTYKLISGETYKYVIIPRVGFKYDEQYAVTISDVVNP